MSDRAIILRNIRCSGALLIMFIVATRAFLQQMLDGWVVFFLLRHSFLLSILSFLFLCNPCERRLDTTGPQNLKSNKRTEYR